MLSVLQTTTRQIGASPEVDRVLITTVEALHHELGYEYVAVHLRDRTTGALTLCALAGAPGPRIPFDRYYLGPDTTPGQAAQTGRPVRIDDLAQHSALKSALGLAPGNAELAVPILDAQVVLGTLFVGATRRGRLGAEDEACLTTFAAQLSAALRGAEVLRQAVEREAHDQVLAHLSRAINQSLEPAQVLAQTVAVVGEQLKADRCALSLVSLQSNTILTEHEYLNPLLAERRSLKRPYPLSDSLTEVARRLQTGEVLLYDTPGSNALPDDQWEMLTQRYGVRSLAWVPIPSQTQDKFYSLQVMQVICARTWTTAEVALLRRLADQLALALRNAELYTAAQQTAAALKAKHTELETFVYTVSHDLQAAVASVNGFATLLQTRYQTHLDERGNLYVARIAVNADYLSRMLRHLLELSRVGRIEEPDETVPVGVIIEEVLNDLARPLAERKVALELPPVWPLVRYSRVRLREVFFNLISNAVKFLGAQPTPLIEIGWQRLLPFAEAPEPPTPIGPHLIEFFVKDNGIGIDPVDQPRIFIPFQRLEKVDVEGSGVGLSIVKRIIEARGGTLRLDSQPGAGAAFYFTLPAAPENNDLTLLGSGLRTT